MSGPSTKDAAPAGVVGQFWWAVRRLASAVWARVGHVLTAAYLLAALVAILVMSQATQLLGAVQSVGRSAYTMAALTRPPVPWGDDDVVGAFEAWRLAAATTTSNGAAAVDERLLQLIQSWVVWHAALDMVFFAPAIALILWWVLGRVYGGTGSDQPATATETETAAANQTATGTETETETETETPAGTGTVDAHRRRRNVRLVLPGAYLVADLAETGWTLRLALDVLEPSASALSSGVRTNVLLTLTALKWSALLATLVVIVLCVLSRDDGFSGLRHLGRRLWVLRVQVSAVGVLAALLAVPISGALDQIPDLLRSAHDESWFSTAVLYPVTVLIGFSALVWSSGLLIVSTIPSPRFGPTAFGARVRARVGWAVLVLMLVLGAVVLSSSGEELRASPGVWAAPLVAGVLLLLDGLVLWLTKTGVARNAAPLGPELTSGDRTSLERVVVVLAAAPLAIGGLGVVRAYGALVLLQSGDSSRPVHPGATAWFWAGAIAAVIAPLAVFWALSRVDRRLEDGDRRLVVAAGVFAALGSVVCACALGAAIDPAGTGAAVEAHGLVILWLALLVSVLGLLQWLAEKLPPVPLARAFRMRRTPWILCLVLVSVVASAMDTKVGYHAVTLEDDQPDAEQVALSEAVDSWYAAARVCRPDAEVLPMVLVAAPGGGARAAYWTGQVMSRLQARDACEGGSVFAASGVSGGSVGLAAWSATAESGVAGTEGALEKLVGPDALSATVAGMLFRDLPRSFVGLHPYGADRAAVEQDVWIEQVPEMGGPFYSSAESQDWSPLLIFNSSDIATGCKIVVSQLALGPGTDDGPDDGPDAETPTAQACTTSPDPEETAPLSLEAGSVDAVDFLDSADCSPSTASNLSLAAASLLSARFPYVSPFGALTSCGEAGEDDAERLFGGDGGYLENSGLHTLLALWQDMEPIVAQVQDGGPRVLPLAVLVDNHYRSKASLRPTGRVRELTGPASADRTSLSDIHTLEQEVAAEFGPSVPGQPGGTGPRWFVIAPSTRPDISAPLGWSLSEATRRELDCQLPPRLEPRDEGDDCAEAVGKIVGGDGKRLVRLLRPS